LTILISSFFYLSNLYGDTAIIENSYKQARKGGIYKNPSEDEFQWAEHLFYKLIKGEMNQKDFKSVEKYGFRIKEIPLNNNKYYLLTEDSEKKFGRGFYLFSATPVASSSGSNSSGSNSSCKSLVLMVPHGFYDLYTDNISFKLLNKDCFTACAWNTVHRHGKFSDNYDGKKKHWDLADLDNSYFIAFTRAFARAIPNGFLLQIHGFSKKKRISKIAQQTDMVVSSGNSLPANEIQKFSACLNKQLPAMVRLYPDEIRDLGATQNISGKVLRSLKHPGFIHIEMSYQLRRQLIKNVNVRKSLLNCIQGLTIN